MQMTFERFGRSVTLPALPEDMAKEIDALPNRIRRGWEYGWKQWLSDAFAGAKTADEFEGKLMARYDGILAGTVKSPGTGAGRGPTKSPLEKEILRLATQYIDAAIENSGSKPAKEKRVGYIAAYQEAHADDLLAEAELNLEAIKEKVAESGDILAELMGMAKPQE